LFCLNLLQNKMHSLVKQMWHRAGLKITFSSKCHLLWLEKLVFILQLGPTYVEANLCKLQDTRLLNSQVFLWLSIMLFIIYV